MTTVSTHVLDTDRGRPAVGVRVELYREDELIVAGETNDDGRIPDFADVDPGVYRLAFHTSSPFFHQIDLKLELGDGHYHVPLLLSPYSCTTYRGS